jgi:methyltransferase
MDSRVAYTGLVALVAASRLVELAVSRRNVAILKARGAIEFGAGHYPWMVAIHALFLLSCLLEVWLLDRRWIPALGVPMLGVLALATALRYWAIRTLGTRWNTRVVLVPGEPLLVSGPYRWMRHPNYLGVMVELAALPLVHTAWMTSAVFSVLNVMMLAQRVRVEEAAQARWSVNRGRVNL